MGLQIVLGCGVGAIVALISWLGNRTPHLISTFPDGLTLVALFVLLSLAIQLDHRRHGKRDRATSLRAGMTIAAATGVVFGLVVAALGAFRFSVPSPPLLVFGFLTAFGSSLACALPAVAGTLRPQTPAA
jgi:uncharacterized protein YacL